MTQKLIFAAATAVVIGVLAATGNTVDAGHGDLDHLEVPAHTQPHTKAECLATWKSRGRIPVPTNRGKVEAIDG